MSPDLHETYDDKSFRYLEQLQAEMEPLYAALEYADLEDPRWERLDLLGRVYSAEWGKIAKAQGLFE